jgi:hypothetical protein
MNYEYIIVKDINSTTGFDTNMDSNLFFKINRFYQNKCMEQDSNIWKCKILYNKLYLKKVFGNQILEITDKPIFYCENTIPMTTSFQKKNITFIKKCFYKNIITPIPEYFPKIPDEFTEVNEICFQIENLNSKEIYQILLKQITNLKSKEKYYNVSYITQSREMFYMLLPFYLWENPSSEVKRKKEDSTFFKKRSKNSRD